MKRGRGRPSKYKDIRELSKAWNKSGDMRYIQRLFGYKNYFAAEKAIMKARASHPELFPMLRDILPEIPITENMVPGLAKQEGGP